MSDGTIDASQQNFCDAAEEMTKSIASVRELIQVLREKQQNTSDFDFKDGISLLSLKNELLLSYMQSRVLLHSHRVLGHSLTIRSPPLEPFNSLERGRRGADAGDLVDSMIETRIVLEKIKLLESKMRYQIEKLVSLAADEPSDEKVINDPLAFRPNPGALVGGGSDEDDNAGSDAASENGVYRPPKLAPMPYIESTSKEARARRRPHAPHALASLAYLAPNQPFVESATGLGITPSMQSARARELRRMEEFEEENMTRLVLKKKDERRRRKDGEDIALGGVGGIIGKRRGGGLEDEFADVLREEHKGRILAGDGYEELRMKGRREDALARSRVREREDGEDVIEERRQRKKGRFERDVRVAKKRWAKKHHRQK
ncbi:hypothetical protein B0F90DRAFT_1667393 [Multifurca ochricompacta]|uniref:Neuroguidin n=1 Tax=Multifurca ochricompacta TaxID=376703 RepID=A0AAD4QM56_9AGAM|nr:hypothetical protein B0F90DRAFT_1667393 [Multifurca ochricompacta]